MLGSEERKWRKKKKKKERPASEDGSYLLPVRRISPETVCTSTRPPPLPM
jgi:hypothetical protein